MELAPGTKHFEDSDFCLAADIGQQTDPTAVCILERVKHSHVRIDGKILKQWYEYKVRYLERLPLGTDYVQQVTYIKQLYHRPPLNGACVLLIDDTGVGKAVGDIFVDMGMKPLRVTITAGDGDHWKSPTRWHISKSLLVSVLDAKLHQQELKISAGLAEAPALREELKDFRRSVTAAGRFTYEARVGKHDDIVLAVSMAVANFVLRKPPPVAHVGHARFIPTNKRSISNG